MVLPEQSTKNSNVAFVSCSIQIRFQLGNSTTSICVSQQNKKGFEACVCNSFIQNEVISYHQV